MAYKLLGIVVWKAGVWYARRRFVGRAPYGKALAGGAVALALVVALFGARWQRDSLDA